MTPTRVLVTRPAREAARWVEALCAAGLDAVALPLIAIAPASDMAVLQAARASAGEYQALMFVSAAAVEHFFCEPNEAVAPMQWAQSAINSIAYPRCWATGPGTARALQGAGVPASAIDAPTADAAQFDSEALWGRVAGQVRPGHRVLIVRGADQSGQANGRDWLARAIESAGGQVDTVVAYRRLAPKLNADAQRLARQGAAGAAVWLFSSSEAIGNLGRALPGTAWQRACAVATHPRIGQAAQDAGFGTVRVARPTLDGVVASIESLR